MSEHRKIDRSLVGQLLLMAAGTFAFGYMLVPLYDVFCDITGLGGRTNESSAAVTESPDTTRTITVQFVTTVNEYAPWEFEPTIAKINVHPGKLYDTTFFARNLTDSPIIGQAVPSVTPTAAASHFKKTECFCFTAQAFEPAESKNMPVQFLIDRDLPTYIDTITLSYTFFRNDTVAATRANRALGY